MKFEIVDVKKNKIVEIVDETKNDADRRFVELKKENPKRKLWLKMATK